VEELQAASTALAATATKTNTSRPLVLAELAEAQLDAGDAAAAAKTAAEALALARIAYTAKHYVLGIPLFALARAQLAQGDAAGAEPLLREALALRQPPHPAADPRVLEVKVALVDALTTLKRDAEAQALRAEIEPLLAASSTPYAADLRARLAAAMRPRIDGAATSGQVESNR
jgi:serine/threonine-protein kinase